jgi:hypothetical protein
MENTIGFIAGSLFKLVDEISDNPFPEFNTYKDYIQTLCTVFVTLWLFNDIYTSIALIIIIIPVCFYVNQIDTVYWKTLLAIPFITLLLQYNTLEYKGLHDTLGKLAVYFFLFIGILIEDKMFPEEKSTNKTISRVVALCLFIWILYFTNDMPAKPFIHSIVIFMIGYFTTSILFQTFVLPSDNNLNIDKPMKELQELIGKSPEA